MGRGAWRHMAHWSQRSRLNTEIERISNFHLLTPSTVTVIHTRMCTHIHTKGSWHLSSKLIVQGLHRKQDTEKEASASLVFEGYCFGCWKFLHWPLAKIFLSTESMWPPFKEWSRIWLPVEITGNDLGPLSERWWNFYYNGETSSGHT